MMRGVMSPIVIALTGTGLILLGWYVIVASYAFWTRPRDLPAGPPTSDLGPEPPAVVNLLVTRCELIPDAADATLLDLAARHIVELFQPGDNPADLAVRVRQTDPTGLTPYERRVFDRVRAIAPDRFVPLEEITKQLTDGGPAWFMQLRAEVIADAVARGLVRARRFGGWMVLVSILAGMAIAGLALVPLQRDPLSRAENAIAAASVPGWFCGSIFVAFILILFAANLTRTPGQTKLGATVGSRWLGVGGFLSANRSLADLPPAAVAVWDRYLAYGVARGVNPVASRAIDLKVSRVVRLRSRYSGMPRLIEVRYPRGALHYAQAGVRLLWSLVILAIWSGVGFALWATGRTWPALLRDVVIAVGILAVLRALYTLVRATYAKLAPVTVVGQVLACHPFRVSAPGTFGWVQLVVDDGRHRRTEPWLIRADRLGSVQVGDVVTLRGQGWNHFVLSLTVGTPVKSIMDSR
jgi:hypothetical protein